MNIEWNIPMFLTTPYGILPLNSPINTTIGVSLVLDPAKCGTSAGIRLTRDVLSQADGSQTHREFTEGYTVHLGGWLMLTEDHPACGLELREAWQEIQRHCHVLLGNDVALDGDNARLTWTPTGNGQDRILGDVRLLEEAQASYDSGITAVTFAIHSRYPHAVDVTQHTTSFAAPPNTPQTLVNAGNVPGFPIIKVHGPVAGSFVVANQTTGKQLVYDTSLPGSDVILLGDYALIETFRETIYRNGNESSLKAGIDVANSDFWTLEPGSNSISVGGDIDGDTGFAPLVDVIWNDPWY